MDLPHTNKYRTHSTQWMGQDPPLDLNNSSELRKTPANHKQRRICYRLKKPSISPVRWTGYYLPTDWPDIFSLSLLNWLSDMRKTNRSPMWLYFARTTALYYVSYFQPGKLGPPPPHKILEPHLLKENKVGNVYVDSLGSNFSFTWYELLKLINSSVL